jgi:hypothetical protein
MTSPTTVTVTSHRIILSFSDVGRRLDNVPEYAGTRSRMRGVYMKHLHTVPLVLPASMMEKRKVPFDLPFSRLQQSS